MEYQTLFLFWSRLIENRHYLYYVLDNKVPRKFVPQKIYHFSLGPFQVYKWKWSMSVCDYVRHHSKDDQNNKITYSESLPAKSATLFEQNCGI